MVDCDLRGNEWTRRVAASKFSKYEGFGMSTAGHIALQDHGNDVWFRNIKIRDLSAPMSGEVTLFNGQNLDGWGHFLAEDKDPGEVWSVKDGVLVCKGTPAGYIKTDADYTSYVLKLEWRFSPVTKKAGNSGVLLRVTGEDKIWPACLEAQLMSENAGDFWNIGQYDLDSPAERTRGRNIKKTHINENPVGEWNEYEIIVDGGTVTLMVNGEELNRTSGAPVQPGKIALQSEGAEIHFRNIRLAPIR